MKERVQKLMARADMGSRRACEKIIEDGRVTINGRRATLGDQADPSVDEVRVDGARLKTASYKPRYYVFNKPKNVLSVNSAPQGDDRPIVRDLIPVEGHLFVIGRLDAESEGLMVLTNDGDIAHKLAHPSFEHTKTYKVQVYGHPTPAILQQWEQGVWIDDHRSARCYVRVMEKTPKLTTLRIVMIEGRKRQIRRIATLLGFPVARLVRTHIGQLGLGTLGKGSWYQLSEEEVASMLMPSEELKYIKRRRRTFRAKTDAPQATTTQTARPGKTPVEDRHRSPVDADRSRLMRVRRNQLVTPEKREHVYRADELDLNMDFDEDLSKRPVAKRKEDSMQAHEETRQPDRATRPASQTAGYGTRKPQRRRAEGNGESTENPTPEAPTKPAKPTTGKRNQKPPIGSGGGKGRPNAISKTPPRGNNRGQRGR